MNALFRLLLIVGLMVGVSFHAFSAEGVILFPTAELCDQNCGCESDSSDQQSKQKCPGVSCTQCSPHVIPVVPVDVPSGKLSAPWGMFAPVEGSVTRFPETPIFMIEKPPLI